MRVIYYPFLHCGEGLRLDKNTRRARRVPVQAYRPAEGDVRDLVITNVADFKFAVVHVAQHHVDFAEAAEIAETHEPPFLADRAQEGGVGGEVVAGVVTLDRTSLV